MRVRTMIATPRMMCGDHIAMAALAIACACMIVCIGMMVCAGMM
jgi:hypothetical protein